MYTGDFGILNKLVCINNTSDHKLEIGKVYLGFINKASYSSIWNCSGNYIGTFYLFDEDFMFIEDYREKIIDEILK